LAPSIPFAGRFPFAGGDFSEAAAENDKGGAPIDAPPL
jgi:hypothetical protein